MKKRPRKRLLELRGKMHRSALQELGVLQTQEANARRVLEQYQSSALGPEAGNEAWAFQTSEVLADQARRALVGFEAQRQQQAHTVARKQLELKQVERLWDSEQRAARSRARKREKQAAEAWWLSRWGKQS